MEASYAHIYRADDCVRVSKQDLDDSEFLYVKLLTEDELLERINGGDFKQSLHVLAYYLYKASMQETVAK